MDLLTAVAVYDDEGARAIDPLFSYLACVVHDLCPFNSLWISEASFAETPDFLISFWTASLLYLLMLVLHYCD